MHRLYLRWTVGIMVLMLIAMAQGGGQKAYALAPDAQQNVLVRYAPLLRALDGQEVQIPLGSPQPLSQFLEKYSQEKPSGSRSQFRRLSQSRHDGYAQDTEAIAGFRLKDVPQRSRSAIKQLFMLNQAGEGQLNEPDYEYQEVYFLNHLIGFLRLAPNDPRKFDFIPYIFSSSALQALGVQNRSGSDVLAELSELFQSFYQLSRAPSEASQVQRMTATYGESLKPDIQEDGFGGLGMSLSRYAQRLQAPWGAMIHDSGLKALMNASKRSFYRQQEIEYLRSDDVQWPEDLKHELLLLYRVLRLRWSLFGYTAKFDLSVRDSTVDGVYQSRTDKSDEQDFLTGELSFEQFLKRLCLCWADSLESRSAFADQKFPLLVHHNVSCQHEQPCERFGQVSIIRADNQYGLAKKLKEQLSRPYGQPLAEESPFTPYFMELKLGSDFHFSQGYDLYRLGSTDGQKWMILEYRKGRISEPGTHILPDDQVLKIGRQVAQLGQEVQKPIQVKFSLFHGPQRSVDGDYALNVLAVRELGHSRAYQKVQWNTQSLNPSLVNRKPLIRGDGSGAMVHGQVYRFDAQKSFSEHVAEMVKLKYQKGPNALQTSVILVADDLPHAFWPLLVYADGLIVSKAFQGGELWRHAQGYQIPLLFNISDQGALLKNSHRVLLDGNRGKLYGLLEDELDPISLNEQSFTPALLPRFSEPTNYKVSVQLEHPDDLQTYAPVIADPYFGGFVSAKDEFNSPSLNIDFIAGHIYDLLQDQTKPQEPLLASLYERLSTMDGLQQKIAQELANQGVQRFSEVLSRHYEHLAKTQGVHLLNGEHQLSQVRVFDAPWPKAEGLIGSELFSDQAFAQNSRLGLRGASWELWNPQSDQRQPSLFKGVLQEIYRGFFKAQKETRNQSLLWLLIRSPQQFEALAEELKNFLKDNSAAPPKQIVLSFAVPSNMLDFSEFGRAIRKFQNNLQNSKVPRIAYQFRTLNLVHHMGGTDPNQPAQWHLNIDDSSAQEALGLSEDKPQVMLVDEWSDLMQSLAEHWSSKMTKFHKIAPNNLVDQLIEEQRFDDAVHLLGLVNEMRVLGKHYAHARVLMYDALSEQRQVLSVGIDVPIILHFQENQRVNISRGVMRGHFVHLSQPADLFTDDLRPLAEEIIEQASSRGPDLMEAKGRYQSEYQKVAATHPKDLSFVRNKIVFVNNDFFKYFGSNDQRHKHIEYDQLQYVRMMIFDGQPEGKALEFFKHYPLAKYRLKLEGLNDGQLVVLRELPSSSKSQPTELTVDFNTGCIYKGFSRLGEIEPPKTGKNQIWSLLDDLDQSTDPSFESFSADLSIDSSPFYEEMQEHPLLSTFLDPNQAHASEKLVSALQVWAWRWQEMVLNQADPLHKEALFEQFQRVFGEHLAGFFNPPKGDWETQESRVQWFKKQAQQYLGDLAQKVQKSRFQTPEGKLAYFRDRLDSQLGELKPQSLLYSLSTLSPQKLNAKIGGVLFESPGDNPALDVRGAARYLSDMSPWLRAELSALKELQESRNLPQVNILIRSLQGNQIVLIKGLMAIFQDLGLTENEHFKIGIQVEHPENVLSLYEALKQFPSISFVHIAENLAHNWLAIHPDGLQFDGQSYDLVSPEVLFQTREKSLELVRRMIAPINRDGMDRKVRVLAQSS